MTSIIWILEVQKYDVNNSLHSEWNGQFEHIGYMNKFFLTKQEACDYYDLHNPQMRSLNEYGTWQSDYDPITYLRYVVRKYYGEYLKIEPFTENLKEYNF